MGATEKNGELVFLHKVSAGPADKSYGIHVAKLAGMPAPLLKCADQILQKLENKEAELAKKGAAAPTNQPTPQQPAVQPNDRVQEAPAAAPLVEQNGQMELFNPQPAAKKLDKKEERVLNQLKELNLMGMTPMEVMNQLYDWQQKLK